MCDRSKVSLLRDSREIDNSRLGSMFSVGGRTMVVEEEVNQKRGRKVCPFYGCGL